MTENLPDYARLDPPAETSPVEYTVHERRAEILQVLINAGSPFAVKQRRLADRYDVHESTVSRDMDRLRESVDGALGADAKLTTRTVFEKTVRELQAEGEWKEAWDVVMDWNEWLADLGEQHREPDRSELDVAMDSRHSEISYTVVREGDDEPLPTTEDPTGVEQVDHEELGFTASPSGTKEIDVEHPRSDRDE